MEEQFKMFDSDFYYPDLREAKEFLGRTLSKTKYEATKRRNLDFSITIDDLIRLYKKQNGRCALTGRKLEFTRGGSFKNGTNGNSASIDRIYNRVGYKSWNIQLVCWEANAMKTSYDNNDFLNICKEVSKNI